MIDHGIYQLIVTADIGLVGGLWPDGVPDKIPPMPFMTYQNVGGSSQPTLETSGMQRERWQFDIFAPTREVGMNAYWAFRSLLEGFQGRLPNGSYLDNAEHLQRMSRFESDPRQFHVITEFHLYFTLP